MKNFEILKQQQEILLNKSINIVTCGNCGEPFVVTLEQETHTCPFCAFQSDSCDFPDLFH
jgi:endogenous inhibitor of DNA gyrase (YacG/DUF329 family)